jgi:hypothetical protein
MKIQVENMLDKGIIRTSNSAWSTPAVLVPKRSLDGKPKYRFCVDFRALNSVTKFDQYPLPKFETTSTLFGSRYFTVLNCYIGFRQVNIKEHKEKNGVSCPFGQFEFNRLPFGLSNNPSNFQRLIGVVLKNLIGTDCWVFLDIIVFSKTAEEHALSLESVLKRFDEANLQLHPGECEFAKTEVRYLGFLSELAYQLPPTS